jgi:hypothetical protein
MGPDLADAWFEPSDLITSIRVTRETELEGLGYPDLRIHSSGQRLTG